MSSPASLTADVLAALPDGAYLVDRDRTVTYWNGAAQAISGYSPSEVLGHWCGDGLLNHVDDTGRPMCGDRCPLLQTLQDGRYRTARVMLHHREGHMVPVEIRATAVRDADGRIVGALETFRDDTRRFAEPLPLREPAEAEGGDALTGLGSRASLESTMVGRLAALSHDAVPLGVILCDLDGFTAVNDLVGHGAGDLVLAQTARRLRAVVPAQETVARWGGDEFAVLMENAAAAQEIIEFAERLADAVAKEPFRVADREIGLTASVGVALANDESPPGLVLRNADVAMARAKDGGGGRVEVYAAHMHADVVRRLDMVSDLQRAIAREELTLQYQPIVELATSRVTGAEALVRWWRGDEAVSPRAFLAVAEDSGLIVPLGEWVLRKACAQGAAWRAASCDVGVSVNLSLRQLNAPQFPAQVAAALAESGLPPSALTIEVGERLLVEDADLIVDRLTELRDLGVKLAIDDFGIGYASLAHLRQLPVDIIKIDPSFVAGLGQDPTLTLLTKTIVQVGRDLGMQVVAEGIEQPRQLAELREMGCEYGQGFLIAKPMAAARVEALIRTVPSDAGGATEAHEAHGSHGSPDVNGTAKPGVPAA